MSLERVPYRRDLDLRARVAAGRPFVVTGLTAGWPQLDIGTLRAYADASVVVAGVHDGKLSVDARRGIPQRSMRLGEFLDGLEAGVSDTYLITPMGESLPQLLATIPMPAVVSGASFQSVRLWVGPAGLRTPLHQDLPENFFVQLQGRKRVILIDRKHSRDVYPHGVLSAVPNFAQVDAQDPDLERFPRFRKVTPTVLEVAAGEGLYIPTRWWHQLDSLEESMSLALWFADGIPAMMGKLSHAYASVRGLRQTR